MNDGFFSDTAGDLSATHKDSSNFNFEDDQGPEIKIITGAFKLGKLPD